MTTRLLDRIPLVRNLVPGHLADADLEADPWPAPHVPAVRYDPPHNLLR